MLKLGINLLDATEAKLFENAKLNRYIRSQKIKMENIPTRKRQYVSPEPRSSLRAVFSAIIYLAGLTLVVPAASLSLHRIDSADDSFWISASPLFFPRTGPGCPIFRQMTATHIMLADVSNCASLGSNRNRAYLDSSAMNLGSFLNTSLKYPSCSS